MSEVNKEIAPPDQRPGDERQRGKLSPELEENSGNPETPNLKSKEELGPGATRFALMAMVWAMLAFWTWLLGLSPFAFGMLLALPLGAYATVSIVATIMLFVVQNDGRSPNHEKRAFTIMKKPWPGHLGSSIDMIRVFLIVKLYLWLSWGTAPWVDPVGRDLVLGVMIFMLYIIGYGLGKLLFFALFPRIISDNEKMTESGKPNSQASSS